MRHRISKPISRCINQSIIRSFSHHTYEQDVKQTMNYSLIVAATQRGGIGLNGDLPWGRKLKEDLSNFKRLTTSINSSNVQSNTPCNAVIMGRKTWDSLPLKFRPLPDRINVVVTQKNREAIEQSINQSNEPSNDHSNNHPTLVASSFTEALTQLKTLDPSINEVFLIGGSSLIKDALHHHKDSLQTIYYTQVYNDLKCDVHLESSDMPAALADFRLDTISDMKQEEGIHYQFLTYQRNNQSIKSTSNVTTVSTEQISSSINQSIDTSKHPEYQYLDLVRHVIDHGHHKPDRTGTGTRSQFGAHMRFSLQDSFPMLTTKRVYWKGVVEELLWLVSGCTDSKVLHDRGVTIWDANGSREYLDAYGFADREVGDLGPVYGHQWRHFNAPYQTCHTDYSNQGVDQLANIINTIKTNPHDRRMIMSAWNPCQLKEMALPPCHLLAQFYVHDNQLDCQMYQRSADLGLGVPFNIASYSLLTCMIAQVTGLTPGEFVYCIGDAHVYQNHVQELIQQCERQPRPFPKLNIKRNVTDIDQFTAEDFELIDYKPHPAIKMAMAV